MGRRRGAGGKKDEDAETFGKYLYVVGRVNSGKSTFVNRFLHHIGYRHLGSVNFKRGVGGITRSPLPGTTAHFISFALPRGFRLIDTPGVPSTHQITSKLRNTMDLYDVVYVRARSACRQCRQ